MTKKEFCKSIRDFKKLKDKIEKVHNALRELSPDFGGLVIEGVDEIVLDILSKAIGDKADWIEYFIYDLEYGKRSKLGDVIDHYNKKWKLDTPEKLYDLIKLK